MTESLPPEPNRRADLRADPRSDPRPEGFDVAAFPLDGARMHRFDPAMESLAQAAVQYALERIRLDPPPIDGPRTKSELDRYGPTVTADGLGGMSALRLFCEHLAPASISQDHPRALAFVPAAPTEAAVLFDLVLGASSIYAGSWMEGAGAVWAENEALAWVANLAGFPSGAGGAFVSGGTAGNLSALVTARHHAAQQLGPRPPRWLLAATSDVHSSVRAAARVMDIDILSVPSDGSGRMSGAALRSVLDEATTHHIATLGATINGGGDPKNLEGVVFGVVGTGGTTNAGIVDDLAGIAEVARTEGLWFHVDGAYGGAALAAPSGRSRFVGIEQADSFIVDPHKWLFAPYDCCALLYRDPQRAKAAHTQQAGYLDVLQHDNDWNPSDYAMHLTRRARGLPFWFSLATHGSDAYRDAVEATLVLTQQAAELVRAHPHLELAVEPELSVVMFRRHGWTQADYDHWSDMLLAEGTAFVVPSRWQGQPVLRLCFVNPRTTVADVELILATLA